MKNTHAGINEPSSIAILHLNMNACLLTSNCLSAIVKTPLSFECHRLQVVRRPPSPDSSSANPVLNFLRQASRPLFYENFYPFRSETIYSLRRTLLHSLRHRQMFE